MTNVIVVYESLLGNTAEVARAVAEGLGPGARALRADEPGAEDVAGADLIVAGAPVFGFKLSSPQMREGIRKNPGKGPAPDLPARFSAPGWMDWRRDRAGEPRSTPRCAAPSATVRPRSLACSRPAGYASLAAPQGFIVKEVVTARSRPVKWSARARGAPCLRAPSSSGAAPDGRRSGRHARPSPHDSPLHRTNSFPGAEHLTHFTVFVPCITKG